MAAMYDITPNNGSPLFQLTYLLNKCKFVVEGWIWSSLYITCFYILTAFISLTFHIHRIYITCLFTVSFISMRYLTYRPSANYTLTAPNGIIFLPISATIHSIFYHFYLFHTFLPLHCHISMACLLINEVAFGYQRIR